MKTISKHLAILSGLLVLPSLAQDQQTYCDPNARPVFCTPVYSPVCAYPEGCENSLCSYTAINACAACGQSDVVFYTPGECFYNSVDVDEYLHGESEHNGEELEQSGQEEQAGETNEQTGGETGEHGEETGEHGEGSLEEGGSGTEEEVIIPEGGNQETEQPETEEEAEVEQPVEQETEEEEQAGSGPKEETEDSENEESTTAPTNPGNSSSNCPTTGVLVFVSGKFIQGTYCCGAAASCNNKVSPVCGSLNQCVGSLCRETKINSCNACQDSNVKLYFPGTCRQLFGDAEANIEPDNGDGSENSELDTEEEEVENIDDFRLLQFDDTLLNIYLD